MNTNELQRTASKRKGKVSLNLVELYRVLNFGAVDVQKVVHENHHQEELYRHQRRTRRPDQNLRCRGTDKPLLLLHPVLELDSFNKRLRAAPEVPLLVLLQLLIL